MLHPVVHAMQNMRFVKERPLMRLAIADLMFSEFRRKILAEVIGKTENFSNFILGNHIDKYL